MKRTADIDKRMMTECLRLARKGKGSVSPNPMVGAVLVRDGRILSRGYHRRYGGPHAEVECLRRIHRVARNSTLYVNLEPCSHYGKTPPCTDLIIRSGVRNVVVAMKDPNPLVAGRGIRRLRQSGIHVKVGILEDQAREVNRSFIKHVTTGLPYIHVKVAQTLDGKISPRRGESQWITSKESRTLVHSWRSEYDAVLVGAGTILADNPLLTVRLVKGRDPDVVILDGQCRVPLKARVLSSVRSRRIIVCIEERAAARHKAKVARLKRMGITILQLNGRTGLLPLASLLPALRWLDIGSILVEGGAQVFQQFVAQRLFDVLSIFVAPKVMRNGVPAFGVGGQRLYAASVKQLTRLTAQKVGSDVLLHGYV